MSDGISDENILRAIEFLKKNDSSPYFHVPLENAVGAIETGMMEIVDGKLQFTDEWRNRQNE